MKKIIPFILLAIACATCAEKEIKVEPFELNVYELTFDENSGSQYISISTVGNWTLSVDNSSWLELSPQSGEGNGRVQVKVLKNDTKMPRTATVVFINSTKGSAELKIVQNSASPYITVNPDSYEVLAVGQEFTLNVAANDTWNIQIPTNAQAWLSVKQKSESAMEFIASANNTESDRDATLLFSLADSDVATTVKISQKSALQASSIEINPSSADVEAKGGDVEISVSSGVEWQINVTENWVSVKQKENNKVLLSVAENFTGEVRVANVVFATIDGKASATFKINQTKDYSLSSTVTFPDNLIGLPYSQIHNYVGNYGFDYSEHPHCTGGYGGHNDGTHLVVEHDAAINKNVLRFDIHITPVIDGDRCSSSTVDRQRNEFKTKSNNTSWAKIQGNYDEWQVLEWKFKIPVGFQPTSSFCHIHQIKAVDGSNNGSPIITLTPRASSSGGSKRMQIIHSVDGGTGTALGTFVDNIPLSDFEGEWVQVREEIHYTHNGYYACKITRISDGKVLINVEKQNIDMWRKGSSYIRSKYGIYRSLAGGDLSKNPVGQSSLLKNESIWMCDFTVYEKNTNPNPGAAHD